MAGSLTVPNTFATASGNVPASQLDANNTAIVNYVNNREITQGSLAGRPAAGVAGRWYLATDTAGGTLYEDNGTGWTQVAPGVTQTSAGSYRMSGYRGVYNAGTPNTQRDMVADLVEARNPSDGTIAVRTNTGTVTNNILTAGSTANGRDQAGAFTNSTFVHFYWIWNGATLATLSSATPPPTGPTLPSGYTHWAYADCAFLSGGGALVKSYTRGAWSYYETTINLYNALSGTSENTQSVSSQVPANGLAYKLEFTWFGATAEGPYFRLVSGANYLNFTAQTTGTTSAQIEIPNVGQQFLWKVDTNTRATTINLSSFKIPNGGE